MGRNRQPVDILEFKGRSHYSKDELKNRKKSEISAPLNSAEPPKYLTACQKKKFVNMAAQLADIGIFADLDCDALARYILAESELQKLARALKRSGEFEERKGLLNMQAKYMKICRELGAELGLSATSRCKISVPKKDEPPQNKFDKFDAV